MKKKPRVILIILGIFVFLFCCYILVGTPSQAKEIAWGVNFSQKHAKNLGLDWKEAYLALLDDLKIRNFKIPTHWDLIEPANGEYNFEDLDFQIGEAENRGAKILLVIGMKTGRWPECHIPGWAKNLSKEEQQKEILELIEKTVLRYRDRVSVKMWQIENEPFFPFGECPWVDKDFVKEEIEKVKSLDSQKRNIVISDSGEGSLWITAAQIGDVVGTTLYKKVWFSFSWEKRMFPFLPQKFGFYVYYPLPPMFYWRKAQIIQKFFQKKVICVEMQAEPWCPVLLYDCPLAEQEKTMTLEQLKYNLEFAQKTGFDEFYLWGAEWWYWMKGIQQKPEIWEEVKKLF